MSRRMVLGNICLGKGCVGRKESVPLQGSLESNLPLWNFVNEGKMQAWWAFLQPNRCFIIKKGFNMMIYVGFTAIVMALVCTMGILCGKIDLGK